MSRNLLDKINPSDWDSQKPGSSGFNRVRFLQNVDDLVNRPVINRVTATGTNVAVAANGAIQSTGIGTAAIQPLRYAELTNKIRLTFNVNSAGPAYFYLYRTTGNIPAKGAVPNVGDVVVGGDAFAGGPTTSGVNQAQAFSFLDTGLDVTKKYKYYVAVQAPNGNTLNVVSSSHFVMERS